MITWEAQVEIPLGGSAPDRFEGVISRNFRLNHVVSRDDSGKSLSFAGDFVWDWTCYAPRKTLSLLRFYYWVTRGANGRDPNLDLNPGRVSRMRELQYLMLLQIYRSTGKLCGYGTLNFKLWTLWRLARFAEDADCSLLDVLSHSKRLDSFLAAVPNYAAYRTAGWINFLRELSLSGDLDFRLAEPKGWKAFLKRAKENARNKRQHAPLPTRIYSELIKALSDELDDVEEHEDRLIAALSAAVGRHCISKKTSPDKPVRIGPSLISEFGIGDYLTKRGFAHNLDGLNAAVMDIFSTCKLQIHTFSGMRDEEARHLPYYCMEMIKGRHGKRHAMIHGVTTKLNGSRRHATKWVTTEADGFRAVRLAQKFASVIYSSCEMTPSDLDEKRDDFPLFPSTQYLPWNWKRSTHPGIAPPKLGMSELSDYLARKLRPVIEDIDIAELEEIDSFRDWRGEAKFAVGQPWPLSPHQLRRSLALYANASGLVRLSSLRRQLQHLTREMSEYYARGSAFSVDFLAEDPSMYKKHICSEWLDAELEAKYLAFVRDVLNSDEPMHGPAGVFFERQKQRGDVVHEKELRNQIKLGRLSYKEHPLGGCTNSGSCEKPKGLKLLGTVCATDACKHLIGKHSKVLRLLPLQRKMLSGMDPSSIAYEMELEEMQALEKIEEAWRVPA